MCFLKSSILSRFLNLLGTIFHIRLPLKQRGCAPYLEVLVSGNFNNCLLRRSYRVFFKSKKSFMIGGLRLLVLVLTGIFQLITYVCYFHEHSTSYLLIVNLRNLHLPFHILGAEYVCVFYLFDSLKFYYITPRSLAIIKRWHNINFR